MDIDALHREISDSVELIDTPPQAGDAIEQEVRNTLEDIFSTEGSALSRERIDIKTKLNYAKQKYDKFVKSIRKQTPVRIEDGKIYKLTLDEINEKREQLRRDIARYELRLAELKIEGEQVEERIGGVDVKEKPKIAKRKTRITGRSVIQGHDKL